MSFNFLGNFRGMTGSEPQNQLMGMMPGMMGRPGAALGKPGAPQFPGAAGNLTTQAPNLGGYTPGDQQRAGYTGGLEQMPKTIVSPSISPGQQNGFQKFLATQMQHPNFGIRQGIPGGTTGPNSITGGLDISQLTPNRG